MEVRSDGVKMIVSETKCAEMNALIVKSIKSQRNITPDDANNLQVSSDFNCPISFRNSTIIYVLTLYSIYDNTITLIKPKF